MSLKVRKVSLVIYDAARCVFCTQARNIPSTVAPSRASVASSITAKSAGGMTSLNFTSAAPFTVASIARTVNVMLVARTQRMGAKRRQGRQ
jgi:hypothetical protein